MLLEHLSLFTLILFSLPRIGKILIIITLGFKNLTAPSEPNEEQKG